MSDDAPIDADLQRAKAILTDGATWTLTEAYGLLERFVAEIERTRLDVIRAVVTYTTKGYIAGEHADAQRWRLRAEAAEAEVAQLRPWKDAIIDAAVVDWVFTAAHEDDPRATVNDLLVWQQQITLDPTVSKDAKELHDRIAWQAAEIERLRLTLGTVQLERDVLQAERLQAIRLRALVDAIGEKVCEVALRVGRLSAHESPSVPRATPPDPPPTDTPSVAPPTDPETA